MSEAEAEPEAEPEPESRDAPLARMKAVALGLLLAAGVLYLLSTWLGARHPAWGYVAAFAEAAMVGAVADWFAVVALFRHPLGVPVPHTAIIPTNKDRIGRNLAAFIVANFLSTEQVLQRIRRVGVAPRLADWLAEPRHAERMAGWLGAALRYLLGALDDRRVQGYFRSTVLEQLGRIDAATLIGHLIGVLTAERRHQHMLDALLRRLAHALDDAALQARVAEVIAVEVKVLRVIGLDVAAGRFITGRIVAGVIRLIGEMAADADHPLRRDFDAYVTGFAQRLQDDAGLRAQVESAQRDLLASPMLADYLQGVWSDVVRWVRDDLQAEDSVLRERSSAGVRLLGDKLRHDPAMQAWVDEQLMSAAPRWIERYREDIRAYIVDRVGEWNTVEMTRELERNIGRDLQFIRINGTLVGGLVGLGIYAATRWVAG